jgi:phosphoglycolate phosphatase
MKKIIVFDFDGTIADTFPEAVKVLNEILPSFGLRKVEREDLKIFRSEGTRKTLKQLKIPWIKIIRINKKLMTELKGRVEFLELIRGMDKTLKELKNRGYKLGILTGNLKESVEKFLNKNDLEIFDFIYSGGGILGKHLAIKKMMKKEGLKKEDFVYVGDEVRDIEACKKVGVKIISVAWGFNDYDALGKYKPDWLIKKPEEILEIDFN